MIWVFIYSACTVFLAWYNAYLIERGRKIHHWINGLLHVTAAVLIGIFFKWNYGLAVLPLTRVVFDVSLNLLRGLPLTYVPINPKSVVDKLEKIVFKYNFLLAKISYVVMAIILFLL